MKAPIGNAGSRSNRYYLAFNETNFIKSTAEPGNEGRVGVH
jgi:hypothetical protein